MITLNHKQANAIVRYLRRDMNLPVADSFMADDTAEFIWESLEWLVNSLRTWKSDSLLATRLPMMNNEEFINLVARLCDLQLVQLPDEVEETSIPKLQRVVSAITGQPCQLTDKLSLWNAAQVALRELHENGYGDNYTATRGWLSQQDSYEECLRYFLVKLG